MVWRRSGRRWLRAGRCSRSRAPTCESSLYVEKGRRCPESRLCQQYSAGCECRRCSVRIMLRPACVPSPPDWLREDAAIGSARRRLRSFVTPARGAVRGRAALGIRLEGRTGNLPAAGLAPGQLRAAREAACSPLMPSRSRNRMSDSTSCCRCRSNGVTARFLASAKFGCGRSRVPRHTRGNRPARA